MTSLKSSAEPSIKDIKSIPCASFPSFQVRFASELIYTQIRKPYILHWKIPNLPVPMVSHVESDCDQLHFLRLSIVPKSVQNFVGNAFGDKISTSTIVSQV